MRLLFACLCSLVLLSCQKEVPKYPDHPITYEVVGDSVTVYRHFISEWRIDKETFEKIPMAYEQYPELSFSYGDTIQFKLMQITIDSFNRSMVEAGVFVELETINIVVNDTVSSLSFKKKILDVLSSANVNGRSLSINGASFWYENRTGLGGYSNIYFDTSSINIINSYYNWNRELTEETQDDINDSIQGGSVGLLGLLNSKPNLLYHTLIVEVNESATVSDLEKSIRYFDSMSCSWQFAVPLINDDGKCSDSSAVTDLLLGELNGFGGKPIIYLYPEETTDISVQIDSSVDFTFTYPHYPDSGWNVTAEPSGDLTDTVTGKQYYSLFWEGYINYLCDFSEGFVVPSNEIVPFLEEKLEILGLNFREAQEFILYWAPVLEGNEFSLIHFATDEYAEAVPLTITPEPDTEIRVMMSFKSVGLGYDVIGQELTRVKRSGYTVVEWGGSNYDRDHLVQ